jgi:anhydro-N-acetylmuramic acid kinase
MKLLKLLREKRLTAIGLNSGTSADGLDLAAIHINFNSRTPKIDLINGKTVRYPISLRKSIHNAINNRIDSIDKLIILDRQLGAFFGEQTKQYIRKLQGMGINPDIVASHGQTVRHLPHSVDINGRCESGTLQLGHPESIAEKTGMITIADFRQADIAAAGEGAPITCYPMWLMFSDNKQSRLLINIGGIANYFYFPADPDVTKIKARDCGPGNTLLDILAGKYFGLDYDRDGKIASRGDISYRLLSLLLADSFLTGKRGISTGRERFGIKFIEKIISHSKKIGLNKYDILATVTELTAISIARNVNSEIAQGGIRTIYLFGGGLKNKYLVNRLKSNLPNTDFISVKKLGHDPDFLEATCYAIMGAMTIHSIPSGLPHITGASQKTIAGRIIQPSHSSL